jgi:hypothetical protein
MASELRREGEAALLEIVGLDELVDEPERAGFLRHVRLRLEEDAPHVAPGERVARDLEGMRKSQASMSIAPPASA